MSSQSNQIDQIIEKLFSERWSSDLANAPIQDKREQLYKTLVSQINGYWSGNTAYNIAVDGGFLKDSKWKTDKKTNLCVGKELTFLGIMFMHEMEGQGNES